jgi:hypothetical protein
MNNKSAGHPSLLSALLDAGVLGWAGGKAGYTVKPQYRERFGLTFSTVEDGSLHSHPVSRSGLWYRNRMSTRFLYWEDVFRFTRRFCLDRCRVQGWPSTLRDLSTMLLPARCCRSTGVPRLSHC